MAQRSPSSPHHRHQASLESIIDFQTESPLSSAARNVARRRFYTITDHFEAAADPGPRASYNRSRLIRLTYDYACSPISQDNFLRAFFGSLELPMDSDEDIGADGVESRFFGFADYLFDNFFLPLKASARKTPQPTPAFHSAIQRLQGGGEFVGTPERISALRGACLVRDRHRCTVSRAFDMDEAKKRYKSVGDDAQDDDGNLLDNEIPGSFAHLEVAHILPHSLTSRGRGSELSPSKQAALAILNMFDHGVGYLLEGVDIDRPRNALTLTTEMHHFFGDFLIYFEPIPDAEPHTYRIGTFLRHALVGGQVPVTRTLFLTENRTIDPPSPRLLAIHRAIAHILHLSAAGTYIDQILRDMEDAREQGAQTDGSTDLGLMIHLGMWLDGVNA